MVGGQAAVAGGTHTIPNVPVVLQRQPAVGAAVAVADSSAQTPTIRERFRSARQSMSDRISATQKEVKRMVDEGTWETTTENKNMLIVVLIVMLLVLFILIWVVCKIVGMAK